MGLPRGFAIRCASTDDVHTIVAQRRSMFHAMGYGDEAALDSMAAKFGPWLLARIRSGDYKAWLAVTADGSVAAGAGLWLMDWPPHMIGSGLRRGNIMNIFTAREFRRRGLARLLLEVAIEWCRRNGVDTVILHASPDGRSLYESMGFTASNEMRIRL